MKYLKLVLFCLPICFALLSCGLTTSSNELSSDKVKQLKRNLTGDKIMWHCGYRDYLFKPDGSVIEYDATNFNPPHLTAGKWDLDADNRKLYLQWIGKVQNVINIEAINENASEFTFPYDPEMGQRFIKTPMLDNRFEQ